jgi:serralysin
VPLLSSPTSLADSEPAKPHFTVDQAAVQIDRSNLNWNSGVLGQPATVTYAFRLTAPSSMPDDSGGFTQFNAQQILQAEAALSAWADVANITFVRVGSGRGLDAYSDNATILFGNYSTGEAGAAAFAYYPGNRSFGSASGDVWTNSTFSYNQAPTSVNYGGNVLIHEIGHTLGLSHPGDYDAGPDGNISYANSAIYYEDSRQYSVMSYWSEINTGADFRGGYASAPLLDDIAAIQRIYGANMSTRPGDTTYGFNSTAGQTWYDATHGPLIFAVWDAGGTDTFDFSGYSNNQLIDLRQAAFSNVGGLTGNVAIAQGVVIENAIGGSGNDVLVSNSAANVLDGGLGIDAVSYVGASNGVVIDLASKITWDGHVHDTLISIENAIGSSFDDSLVGDAGNNVLDGGAGGSDYIDGGAGSDTVSYASSLMGVMIDLGAQLTWDGKDHDTLVSIENANGSSFDDQIIGDAGNNVLSGGFGNDILDGGPGGADYIDGGAGSDTVSYSSSLRAIIIDLNAQLTWDGKDHDTLVSIENAIGSSFNDQIIGDAGENVLDGGVGGADYINGGAGSDTVSYASSLRSVIIDLGAQLTWDGKDHDTLVSIENATGSSFDDQIIGGAGDNVLDGGAGGADYINGGAGSDTVSYASSLRSVIIDLGAQLTWDGKDHDNLVSIENATGSNFDDQIVGDAGNNVLSGGVGNDILDGGVGGADYIDGGAGSDTVSYVSSLRSVIIDLGAQLTWDGKDHDTLVSIENATGSSFNDQIVGNAGNNVLDGGGGDDVLFGGLGHDTFRFKGGFGHDVVSDFSTVDDTLEFSHALWSDATSVLSHAAQLGADVMITFDAIDTVLLKNVLLSSLHESNIHII